MIVTLSKMLPAWRPCWRPAPNARRFPYGLNVTQLPAVGPDRPTEWRAEHAAQTPSPLAHAEHGEILAVGVNDG